MDTSNRFTYQIKLGSLLCSVPTVLRSRRPPHVRYCARRPSLDSSLRAIFLSFLSPVMIGTNVLILFFFFWAKKRFGNRDYCTVRCLLVPRTLAVNQEESHNSLYGLVSPTIRCPKLTYLLYGTGPTLNNVEHHLALWLWSS